MDFVITKIYLRRICYESAAFKGWISAFVGMAPKTIMAHSALKTNVVHTTELIRASLIKPFGGHHGKIH